MSDIAKMTERITRPNYGTLNIELTIDDPKNYTKPFTVSLSQHIELDTELVDEFCLENEKLVRAHAAIARAGIDPHRRGAVFRRNGSSAAIAPPASRVRPTPAAPL